MAKVNFVKSAAKDYPNAGIKKGESYYWWKPYRMGKRFSKTQPKPSQVATSDYEVGVLSAIEELEAWEGEWNEDDKNDLVSRLEEIRDAEQEKFDNMPEGLQQGDTGVMLEERVSAIEEWISELESIDFGEEGKVWEEGEETPLDQALASAPSV